MRGRRAGSDGGGELGEGEKEEEPKRELDEMELLREEDEEGEDMGLVRGESRDFF